MEARIVGNREENKLLFPFAIILIINLFSSVVTLLLRFAKIGNMRYHVSDHLAPPVFQEGNSSHQLVQLSVQPSLLPQWGLRAASSPRPLLSVFSKQHSFWQQWEPQGGWSVQHWRHPEEWSNRLFYENQQIERPSGWQRVTVEWQSRWSSFLTVGTTNCRWGLLYHLFIWWGPFYFWVYFHPFWVIIIQ